MFWLVERIHTSTVFTAQGDIRIKAAKSWQNAILLKSSQEFALLPKTVENMWNELCRHTSNNCLSLQPQINFAI